MNRNGRLTFAGKTKPYVMAHRGNKVACPENTLAAFRRAIDDGADILETDLHQSADGVFVCIHDETVDRTTNGKGVVADMTFDELRRLSADHGRSEFEGEQIPSLNELAELLPSDVAFALELKSDCFLSTDVCGQLIAELAQAGVRDRTVVLSFSLDRIRTVQAVASDIPIGWITLTRPWPITGVQFLGPLWPLLLLNPVYVQWAHWRGQMVGPLDPTPDSRLWLYRWLKCDVVLSDDPGATVKALGRPKS